MNLYLWLINNSPLLYRHLDHTPLVPALTASFRAQVFVIPPDHDPRRLHDISVARVPQMRGQTKSAHRSEVSTAAVDWPRNLIPARSILPWPRTFGDPPHRWRNPRH